MTTVEHRAGRTAAPATPTRPVVRPYRGPEDHPAIARIGSAARAANGNPEVVTAAQIDNDYARVENCDLTRDCVLVEIDQRPVAYGRTFWMDRNSGERSYEAIMFIEPTASGRGVESALIGWEIDHLVELEAAHRPAEADRPVVLVGHAHGRDVASRAVLEAAGFANVRRSATLVRPDLADIPDLPLPSGFAVRLIDPGDGAMHRRVFDADKVAFADHWGDSLSDGSETNFRAFVEDPLVRPDLWRVAFHGDDIAGQILSFLETDGDGSIVGWTESISVQPQFRRRGLARALLAESLRAVRDAGAARAALGVDTGNVRRALDLYESLGFEIVSESFEYHRPVMAGSATAEVDR